MRVIELVGAGPGFLFWRFFKQEFGIFTAYDLFKCSCKITLCMSRWNKTVNK